MKRTIVAVALGSVVVIAATFVAQPTILRAVAGLTGRTHLIVREDGIRQLTATLFDFSPFTLSLAERGRDGTVAGTPYVVPAGKVFVVTDVRIAAQGQTQEVTGEFRSGGVLRWPVHSAREGDNQLVYTKNFVAGLVYDAGTTIDFFCSAGGSANILVDVIGYESEATP